MDRAVASLTGRALNGFIVPEGIFNTIDRSARVSKRGTPFIPENDRGEERERNFMKMIPAIAIRKIYLVIPLIFFLVSAFAQSPPAKILYVGAISINPCQDAKVLADWYSQFGIETKEYKGGYYAQLDTAAGPFFFAIHPKKADAPTKCSASVSVVFRVENFESSLLAAKNRGLLPYKTEKDPNEGQFAHFHDPDGNEVTIWGK